eukprot:gene12378-8504_t
MSSSGPSSSRPIIQCDDETMRRRYRNAETKDTEHLASPPRPAPTSGSAPSHEELKRLRMRRRLARKTPAQRQRLQQYHRRHNEKDHRLYYCDYCDVFISTSDKAWSRGHLRTYRHFQNVEAYYALVESLEGETTLKTIRETILEAKAKAKAAAAAAAAAKEEEKETEEMRYNPQTSRQRREEEGSPELKRPSQPSTF